MAYYEIDMEKLNPKIIFMGTPEFGAIILEGLVKSGYKPVLVITETDKPVGRKKILTPPIVKTVALRYNIPILQPERIENTKYQIPDAKPDLIIVAAYGQFLPKEILEIPKYGCLNVHPSLLPKYRGSSPIQSAILNGDRETGVTIILMDSKIDHGPILAQKRLEIKIRETAEQLHDRLVELGAKVLTDTIPNWIKGGIKPTLQDDSTATYSKILKKEDGKIYWKKSAEEIERQIRAFSPWPGSFTEIENGDSKKIIKIFKATVLRQTNHGPFGILGKTYLAPNDKIAVQTGKDFLIIEELQPSGGKRMASKDFLKGHKKFIGIILQ